MKDETNIIIAKKLPDKFIEIGFRQMELTITKQDYQEVITQFGKFINGVDLINQLPDALNNSLAIIEAQSLENALSSIVVLTGIDDIQLLGVITIQLGNTNVFIESIELMNNDK